MTYHQRRAYRMPTALHNEAAASRRLMGRYLSTPEEQAERCHVCRGKLWQYPEPEYWMQYPLPRVFTVDGHSVCSHYCAERYLMERPVRVGEQMLLHF